MHVALINVNMGKALPDKPVIDEMNNTAAQQQRRKDRDTAQTRRGFEA
jgi:hypothetical protein